MKVIKGNSYHQAVTHAEECAQATLEFIRRRGGENKRSD